MNEYYDYQDIFLIPRYSEVITRQEVDTSVKICGLTLQVPIMSSNMDSITEGKMAAAMRSAGAMGALHRFMTIDENVAEYRKCTDCFVSVGVNRDWKERTKALYAAGARHFIIDIAHGHSLMMKNTIAWMKNEFKTNDLHIMAGNVTTAEAVHDLESWGADAIKVGIGNGSVCVTKDVTGVTMPIFSAVMECSKAARVPIVADGGVKSYGDVAKAIAAGATIILSGRFFAGCDEVPDRVKNAESGYSYRGMASTEAMMRIRTDNLPTAEGKSVVVEPKGSAVKVVQEIAGGLRSSYSYMGARTTEEFRTKVTFGVKRR